MRSKSQSLLPSKSTVIAKVARFDWEIFLFERETRAYQLLEGSGLAPRFRGHLHENGRAVGFILEKVEGRFASIEDLSICETAVKKLHNLGLLHGDVNRYNFMITADGVRLIDFEHIREDGSPEEMRREFESLPAELEEETGRGGGFSRAEGSDSDSG